MMPKRQRKALTAQPRQVCWAAKTWQGIHPSFQACTQHRQKPGPSAQKRPPNLLYLVASNGAAPLCRAPHEIACERPPGPARCHHSQNETGKSFVRGSFMHSDQAKLGSARAARRGCCALVLQLLLHSGALALTTCLQQRTCQPPCKQACTARTTPSLRRTRLSYYQPAKGSLCPRGARQLSLAVLCGSKAVQGASKGRSEQAVLIGGVVKELPSAQRAHLGLQLPLPVLIPRRDRVAPAPVGRERAGACGSWRPWQGTHHIGWGWQRTAAGASFRGRY